MAIASLWGVWSGGRSSMPAYAMNLLHTSEVSRPLEVEPLTIDPG
jgi:hypothetical protein